MNCVKGDLARIVNIHPALQEVHGRIVTCVKAGSLSGEPTWKLDRRIDFVALKNFCSCGTSFYVGESVWFDEIPDKYLRPIRDQPGEDEILKIAGKPRRAENVNFPPGVFTITTD